MRCASFSAPFPSVSSTEVAMSGHTKRLCVVTLVGVGFATFAGFAQERTREDSLWLHKGRVLGAGATLTQPARSDQAAPRPADRRLRAFSRFSANDAGLRATLRRAPREFSGVGAVVIAVPLPDGA